MRFPLLAFPLFLTSGLTGCIGGKIEHPGVLAVHALPMGSGVDVPEQFQGSVGFDDPTERGDRPSPQVGDEVLYRAHLSVHGKTQDWYVRLKLVRANAGQMKLSFKHNDGTVETRMSPLWEAAVEVYDCEEETSVVAKMGIAESSITHSIFGQSELLRIHLPTGKELSDLTPEQRQSYVLGVGAVSNLFNGWQQNEQLQPLMKEVIGFPAQAILGMLLRGSFKYTVAQGFNRESATTAVLPDPVGEMVAERIPLSINMGGVTLMHADLTAVKTLGPLGAGLGVVTIRGVHPEDDKRWVEIELIGARGGRAR